MESLILFDLHYQHNNSISREKLNIITEIEGDFDSLLLGGDNAELSSDLQNHRILFGELKRRFKCPIGFVVGNHELWGKLSNSSSYKLLYEVFPALGKEYNLVYLEQYNLDIGDNTFIGTYGHFDYSFLRENHGVSLTDLLSGTFITEGKKIVWNDRLCMDWESKNDREVCRKLVSAFGERIKVAIGEPITISHTIPKLSLNGWPDSPSQYFMEAYSGSNLIGDVLKVMGGEYHFCGHTHAKARDKIGRTVAINTGSDYNILRYAVLQIDEQKQNVEEREVIIT